MKKWIVLFVLLLAGCNFSANKGEKSSVTILTGNTSEASNTVSQKVNMDSKSNSIGKQNNISPEEEKEIINLVNDLLK